MIPSQTGRTVVITGANAGLGFWTALELARAGASVVLACRNEQRADAAIAAIRTKVPAAELSFLALDTARLSSVREAGARLAQLPRIDVLLENAGTVHPPRHRTETVDGLEFVGATNFFGHFALTAAVLPALERTPGSRILTLGSLATRLVRLRPDDLQLRKGYTSWQAYAQSKIMLQSFAFELDRRLQAAGSGIRSLCAHPGFAISGRTPRVPGVNEPSRAGRFADNLQAPLAQGKDAGAEPIVRAAVDPDAFANPGPVFYGPRWRTKGSAVRETPASVTTDREAARAIWAEAEVATGTLLLG